MRYLLIWQVPQKPFLKQIKTIGKFSFILTLIDLSISLCIRNYFFYKPFFSFVLNLCEKKLITIDVLMHQKFLRIVLHQFNFKIVSNFFMKNDKALTAFTTLSWQTIMQNLTTPKFRENSGFSFNFCKLLAVLFWKNACFKSFFCTFRQKTFWLVYAHRSLSLSILASTQFILPQ